MDWGLTSKKYSLTHFMVTEKTQFEKPYSVLEQLGALRKTFSSLSWNAKGGVLTGFGKLRPTPLSLEYNFSLDYRITGNKTAKLSVCVSGSNLRNLDAKDFPHNYGVDQKRKRVKICLYRYKEFSSRRLIAETIVPWTIEWLLFYEGWLITGKWLGGGEHPTKSKKNEVCYGK